MGVAASIDITPGQRKSILGLLKRYLPETTVWAYGSRVKWTSTPRSDLDMVVFSGPEQKLAVSNLKEAFEESDLPFRVDLFSWDEVPEQFRKNIEAEHAVLQEKEERGLGVSSEWPVKRISEVTEFLNQKRIPLKSLDRAKRQGEYPYYGASGIVDYIDDYIFYGTYLLISEDGENLRTRKTPIAFKASGKFWVNNHAHILSEKEDGILDYLEYYFSILDLTPYITGAVQPKLNKANLDCIEIPIPPYDERLAINRVLNGITNKIQLNTQTNQTLEQIAQAIFKSWFVDFAPVRAKMAVLENGGTPEAALLAAMRAISAKDDAALERMRRETPEAYTRLEQTAALFPSAMEPSALGEVPEGWKIKPLSAMIELIGGGTPKRSEDAFWGGDIPWFSVKEAPVDGSVFVIDTSEKITELGLNKSSTKILPEGVTIISARGTVGRLALVGVPMAMNQSCYGVKGIASAFNYFTLKQAVSTLQRQTHGAVFDTITTKTFDTVFATHPSKNIIDEFERLVEPMLANIKNHLYESAALAQSRDSFLPKLLSGEICVSEVASQRE